MKHFKLTFMLAMLMSMVTSIVSAHDFEVDGIYYSYRSGSGGSSVNVTYKGNSFNDYSNEYIGNVIIPESVTYNGKTYNVTSISYLAFCDCSGLISVTIPNSVTSIGNYAFCCCI